MTHQTKTDSNDWKERDLALSQLMLGVLGVARKYNLPTVSPKAMNDELDELFKSAQTHISKHYIPKKEVDEMVREARN